MCFFKKSGVTKTASFLKMCLKNVFKKVPDDFQWLTIQESEIQSSMFTGIHHSICRVNNVEMVWKGNKYFSLSQLLAGPEQICSIEHIE